MFGHLVDKAIVDLQQRVRNLEEKNGVKSPDNEIGPEPVVVPAPPASVKTAQEYESRIAALEELVKKLGTEELVKTGNPTTD